MAENLASQAVKLGLAGCVNVLPSINSVFQWQAQVTVAAEVGLLFKTTESCEAALLDWLQAQHPYEVPALLCWSAQTTEPFAAAMDLGLLSAAETKPAL